VDRHYRFAEEELDFIINYNIKYRMSRDVGEEATGTIKAKLTAT